MSGDLGEKIYLAEVALALLGRDTDRRKGSGEPRLPGGGRVDSQQRPGEALGQRRVTPQRLLQRSLDAHGHELHLGDLHPVRGDNQELLLILEGDALVRDHRPHGSDTAQIGHGLTEHTLRSLELLDSIGDLTGPAQHSLLDCRVGSEEVSRSAEQGVAVARQAVGIGGEELLGDLALTLLEGRRAVDSTHVFPFMTKTGSLTEELPLLFRY